MSGITFWFFYFAPSLIGWYRARQGKALVFSVKKMFFFNFLIGWTGVGWLLILANAFGYNPVAWFAVRYVKLMGAGPAGSAAPPPMPSSSSGLSCSQCQGSGSMRCSSCGGRGSWYDAPQGATGTAQLATCTACTSSGHIRCPYCNGSGRLPG